MHHTAEREAAYKASRGLGRVAEKFRSPECRNTGWLVCGGEVPQTRSCLSGWVQTSTVASLVVVMTLSSQYNIAFSFWVNFKEKLINLSSRVTVPPSWCLCGGPVSLQLSCWITHPPWSPKCHSIPKVSDGRGRAICHLKWKFQGSGEMFLSYEKLEPFLTTSFRRCRSSCLKADSCE